MDREAYKTVIGMMIEHSSFRVILDVVKEIAEDKALEVISDDVELAKSWERMSTCLADASAKATKEGL